MLITVFRLLAFAVSSLGSWELLRRKTRVHLYFLPSLTVAIQVTVLFLAGLLNLLPEMTVLLFAAGIAGFVYSVIRDRGIGFLKQYLNVGYLFLAFLAVVLLIFIQGKQFIHYDNFSHWALVVRQMFAADRYPNFADAIIEFKDYPLGSATYIYYFAKIVSGSESVQMYAQIYMMLTCFVPLFLFVKKNRAAAFLAVLAAANFILVYNISVTNLLVDTLLPLQAMCSFVYAYCYGHRITQRREFWLLTFYLVQLLQIKNSGMFLAAFLILWLLANIRKDRYRITRLWVMALPWVSVLLWKRHCSYVFADAGISKHAVSAEYYSIVFSAKTPEEMRSISAALAKFSFTWPDVWMVFGFVMLVGILVFLFAKKDRMTYVKVALISVIIYLIYQAGLLAMYLFSMPGNEASYLAEIERYTKTILIVIVYLVMIMALRLISSEEIRTGPMIASTVLVAAALFGILYGSTGKIKLVVEYSDNPEERNWIESAMEEYDVPYGASYLILPKQEDGAYSYYLGMYIFQSPWVNEVYVDEPEDLDDVPFQYIFVFDEGNEIVEEWVKEHYPDQAGNKVIKQYALIEAAR
ncbi:MAG: hypothetical protein IJ106_12260 [Parasporobacterium sp.]|nr:hypothetical protein [Parasporobacterium sp.]